MFIKLYFHGNDEWSMMNDERFPFIVHPSSLIIIIVGASAGHPVLIAEPKDLLPARMEQEQNEAEPAAIAELVAQKAPYHSKRRSEVCFPLEEKINWQKCRAPQMLHPSIL
jgi:hypothetical protein